MSKLDEAKKQMKELKLDKTSHYVSARHLWELAYWRAREIVSKNGGG